MLLGLKIATTGVIVTFILTTVMRGPWPGLAIGGALVLAWFVSVAAIVVGLLMAVWA